MATQALSTKQTRQFSDSLDSFSNVGLLMLEGSTNPITFQSSSQTISLTLDQNSAITTVYQNNNFSFNVNLNKIPAINLCLNNSGNPVINGESEWQLVSGTTNRFQWMNGTENTFNVHILLSTTSDVGIMEIILVGTVPTEDD